jgi:hypothetical protein
MSACSQSYVHVPSRQVQGQQDGGEEEQTTGPHDRQTVAMAHCHITQRELLPCYSLTSMGEDLSRSRTGSHSGVLASLVAVSKCTSERPAS